jgi:hypothetical protein
MEHGQTPSSEIESLPTRSLTDAAHAALRAVLGARIRQSIYDAPVPAARLRHAIRLLCDEARRRGVRAEQLVVVIKQAWASLPESRWRAGDDRGTEFLHRVVSICIEEYYADAAKGGLPDGRLEARADGRGAVAGSSIASRPD